MLALGIDPGTATTGFGFVRLHPDGSLELVHFGAILTEAGIPMPDRLRDLFHKLVELVESYQPDTAAVEQLFFQRNVKTAISVGQARGVALLALAESSLSVGEYTPLEIKQAVTGYGKADKRQVQLMVARLLAMDDIPRPDDAADALAVAICHLQSSRLQRRMEEGI